MKALEVDPDKRFQDAGSMGRALEGLAARMGIPLGHAPVAEVMASLFERKSRRRLARASNEPPTDPNRRGLSDEQRTPLVELVDELTDPHELPLPPSVPHSALSARSHRPTMPITGSRSSSAETARFGTLATGTPTEPPAFDAAQADPPTHRDRRPTVAEPRPRRAASTGPEGNRSIAGPNEVRIGDSAARGSPSWGPRASLPRPHSYRPRGTASAPGHGPTSCGLRCMVIDHRRSRSICTRLRRRSMDSSGDASSRHCRCHWCRRRRRWTTACRTSRSAPPTGTSIAGRPRWAPARVANAVVSRIPTDLRDANLAVPVVLLFGLAVIAAILVAVL